MIPSRARCAEHIMHQSVAIRHSIMIFTDSSENTHLSLSCLARESDTARGAFRSENLKEMRRRESSMAHEEKGDTTAPPHLRHVLRSPKKPKLLSNAVYMEFLT